MGSLGNIPFLRPALALCLGIGVSLYLVRDIWPLAAVLLGIAILMVPIGYFLTTRKSHVMSMLSGFVLLLVVFLVGFTMAYYARIPFAKRYFSGHGNNSYKQLRIVLDEDLEAKVNSWRCKASVISGFDSTGQEWGTLGKVLVYWPHRSNVGKPGLQFGDVLLVENKTLLMPSAAFPYDFDFRAVMRYKNVQDQLFLRAGEWKLTGNRAGGLQKIANDCRRWIVEKLHALFPSKEAAIMASLLIGFRDELDAKDLAAFAISGTTHVLAVSGLHVGMLYVLLVFLFTGKKRVKKLRHWQGLTIILILWGFALVTGLSASVVRAALMFSILESGRSLFARQGNLINSLFAAAFLQLLIDPLSLVDAGFQLSYLAVLGIAVIHPALSNLWAPNSRWVYYLYQSATLSVSATIATLPVTLYYFHTFPTWFVPANIWIVPLSTLVIVIGLISMTLATIPYLGTMCIQVAIWFTGLLIQSAHFFANLPAAAIKNIVLTDLETIFLAAMLIGLLGYGIRRSKPFLLTFVSASLLMSLSGWVKHYQAGKDVQLIACELRGDLLLVYKQGNHMDVYSRPLSQNRVDSLYGFMKWFVLRQDIQKVEWHMAAKNGNIVTLDANGNALVKLGEEQWLLVWSEHGKGQPPSGLTIVTRQKNVRKWRGSRNRIIALRNDFRELI